MKRKKGLVISCIVIILLGIISYLIWHQLFQPYYAYAPDMPFYKYKQLKHDSLRVMFLGDSWAAYHSDSILIRKLGIPSCVISKGYVGEKSKSIYMHMFDNDVKKDISYGLDYVIISAGINDVIAKMGKEHYVNHVEQIVRLLLYNKIKPVIMEIPEVNVMAIYEKEDILSKIRHQLSACYTHSSMFIIEDYRRELKHKLYEAGLMDQILYINIASWNANGYKDIRGLYQEDGIHLNENGYSVLDSCLASNIIMDYNSNNR